MPELEDEFKIQDWLSILTFDAFKFAKAGGNLVIEWTDEGLVLRLPGVRVDTEAVNRKFKKYASETAEILATEAEP